MKKAVNLTQAFPEAFLQRMSGLLENEYIDFHASLQLPATTGLRVNALKIPPNEFLDRSPYLLSPVSWCSSGYIVESQDEGKGLISPGKHPHYYAGLYYLQEPSAMAAAETLAPRSGERVLDIAAAPGGKATHLAALMNNTGVLVTNEIHPKRVWDLAENLERCGVTNAIVTNETPQKLADHFGEFFDRVMLDAPCSGEGMFRKSEVARLEWKPELVRSCAYRQTTILEQAARLVRSGGHIVYSTCTFSAEENEGVIAGFLSLHPEFDLEAIQYAPGHSHARPEWIGLPLEDRISRAVRIWPHLTQGEGHFIALLVKYDSTKKYLGSARMKNGSFSYRTTRSKGLHEARSILDDYCQSNLTIAFEDSKLLIEGSYIYLVEDDQTDLTGLNVIHPGWWLGSINNKRFIPSHSLAMGIKNWQARQILPLTSIDPQLSAYFAGESFPNCGENGWVLVTVDGFPVGWGKRVQNVIKNYYPHGLRQPA